MDANFRPPCYNELMNLDRQHVESFCRQRGIWLLVLFGSRATDQARDSSDTDLAVRLDAAISLPQRLQLEQDLAVALDIHGRLDLVVLNTLDSTTLGREIARTGKVLFDADGEQFPSFVIRAMKAYADFEPFRRLRRKALRQRQVS